MEQVTRYKTVDGKEYNCEQAASRHEKDVLCQRVEGFLRKYCTDGHTKSTFQSALAITEDMPSAIATLRGILEAAESMQGHE